MKICHVREFSRATKALSNAMLPPKASCTNTWNNREKTWVMYENDASDQTRNTTVQTQPIFLNLTLFLDDVFLQTAIAFTVKSTTLPS